MPYELDRLQGLPPGWTDTGMTDCQRAFCMGNALVVGVVHQIGVAIVEEAGRSDAWPRPHISGESCDCLS